MSSEKKRKIDNVYFRNYRRQRRKQECLGETEQQKKTRLKQRRDKYREAFDRKSSEEKLNMQKKRNKQQQIRRKRKRREAMKIDSDSESDGQSKQGSCSTCNVPLAELTCWPCGHRHVCCIDCARNALTKHSRCPRCRRSLLFIDLPGKQMLFKHPPEHEKAGQWSFVNLKAASRKHKRKRRRLK